MLKQAAKRDHCYTSNCFVPLLHESPPQKGRESSPSFFLSDACCCIAGRKKQGDVHIPSYHTPSHKPSTNSPTLIPHHQSFSYESEPVPPPPAQSKI
ncbi:hypothetical protein LSTR_LSTR000810 [Laodelphax striatellus]|uniref:Uncharacterized protein n=1 Tax=Laodelphax striatellus TaxID=195883 RepID=A0A482WQC7_LAOST|nr:hypothetical protein LSTR_LSTR016696 [Laodelphax striatellus]RZF44858.1 hypothetical protein LSTR_LSTR000810 [Laodelphax striatellus]